MPTLLTWFGTLMVVVFTAWLNTKTLLAKIEALDMKIDVKIGALRAEMKQQIAEAELRIIKAILELKGRIGRIERLEEQRGLIRQP